MDEIPFRTVDNNSLLLLLGTYLLCSAVYGLVVKRKPAFAKLVLGLGVVLGVTSLRKSYVVHEPKNSAVLITGVGGKGIGFQVGKALKKQGFTILAGVRNEKHFKDMEDEGFLPVLVDVTNHNHIEGLHDHVMKLLGSKKLAGVILLHGFFGDLSFIEVTPSEKFQKVDDINSLGSIRVIQSLGDLLRRDEGRVLLSGSVGAHGKFSAIYFYSRTKKDLEFLGDSLRKEINSQARDGYGRYAVISMNIGGFGTQMTDAVAYDTVSYLQNWFNTTTRGGPKANSKVWEWFRLRTSANQVMIDQSPPYPWADVQDAVPAFVHAITSKAPLTKYHVGFDAKLLATLNMFLPDEFMDIFDGIQFNYAPLSLANGNEKPKQ